MSKQYDNWERLVVAVLRRQHDREIAMCRSTNSSAFSSRSSSFNSEFYDQLHDAINYFNNQRLPSTTSYFEEERSGKKSYMVGARDLVISFGNNSRNWKWIFDDNSRTNHLQSEVAELRSTWRLDVRATIAAGMLDPWTVYGAYLVYKLAETAEGLESAKATIRFVDDESDRDAVKGARVAQLSAGAERGDGWMEVEMGNFYVGQRDDGQVEARLLDIRRWKCGLIVQGIAFRPSCTYTDAPLLSNKYKSTEAWA